MTYPLSFTSMNSHLFTQIPVTSKAKTAMIYFDKEEFGKIDLERVKLPCKYYNLVFLAMETWINQEWDPGEKLMLWALNDSFSSLVSLMENQLDKEVMERIINEQEILNPFTVKLDYNFTL